MHYLITKTSLLQLFHGNLDKIIIYFIIQTTGLSSPRIWDAEDGSIDFVYLHVHKHVLSSMVASYALKYFCIDTIMFQMYVDSWWMGRVEQVDSVQSELAT